MSPPAEGSSVGVPHDAATALPQPARFSAAQLEAALWAGEHARVHAVVDGRVVPGLPARLQAADCLGWDCLQRGALPPGAAVRAACIVELRQGAPFNRWLLHQAASDFGAWGVLMVSTQPLLAMREHSRDLMNVGGPDGRRRTWRWHDPGLLEALLPGLSPDQGDQFFAAGQELVLVGPQRWVWWRYAQGAPAREVRELLATPR